MKEWCIDPGYQVPDSALDLFDSLWNDIVSCQQNYFVFDRPLYGYVSAINASGNVRRVRRVDYVVEVLLIIIALKLLIRF